MSAIEAITLYGMVIIVGAYHLLHLLDRLLGWPHFLVRILQRRRRREVEEVLETLGIPPPARLTIASAIRSEQLARYNDPKNRCITLLRSCAKRGRFVVGAQNAIAFPYFVDVMSESLKAGRRDECAYIMISYLKAEGVSFEKVDYIVGIKAGSPALALTVADKLSKPIALFRGAGQYKYNIGHPDPLALFDGSLEGKKTAVIIDDSTTGGRKAFDCIDALRLLEIKVSEFWVLFEPLGKDTRKALLELKGVTLRSVVQMDENVIQDLAKPMEVI